jgi:hypothetical protein
LSSAARPSRYLRIPRSPYWFIDEPRGDSMGCGPPAALAEVLGEVEVADGFQLP